MNTFAEILHLHAYPRMHLYTVQIIGEESDLFQQFINQHQESQKQNLDVIRSWLRRIGTEFGAREQFFRHEAYRRGDAKALPPNRKYLDFDNHLRLYCMRINDRCVILFCGAVKTTSRPQDCPNVRQHFILANKISRAINDAVREGEIIITDDGTLEFSKGYSIEIPSL